MSENARHFCLNCGGELTGTTDEWLTCKYCGSRFENRSFLRRTQYLKELLNEISVEYVNNQRRNLFDAVNAKHISTTEIRQYATEIKKYIPNDFQANFYLRAISEDTKEINQAIREIDTDANYDSLPPVIQFLTSSLQIEFLLELNDLVERAYKKRDLPLYSKYATSISAEAEKLSNGVYATNIPRDVFIAYSSKDMKKVSELCEELESQGISCFVAARNLRHGVGSVENYDSALKDAMDNCRCFVFVSSTNSRTLSCDAVTKEIPYIRGCDIANAPAHLRNNYSSIPAAYKKPRIEYRVGNERNTDAASKITDAFFDGYEWTYTPEAVALRVVQLLYEEPTIPTPQSSDTAYVQAPYAPVSNRPDTAKKSKAPIIIAAALLLTGAIAAGALLLPKLTTGKKEDSEPPSESESLNVELPLPTPNESESDGAEDAPTASEGLTFATVGKDICHVTGMGTCTDTDLVIPAVSPNGEKVVGIADNAFNDCSTLTSVTIPEGVTQIGMFAFDDCYEMIWVEIPNTVTTISNYAFRNCGLKSLTLPESLTFIGADAFHWNNGLTELDIPEGVTTISSGAFSGCGSIKWVNIPASVKNIEGNVFSLCSELTSITVDPENIRYESVDNCLIEKASKTLIAGCRASVIPADGKVKAIGPSAFYLLSLDNNVIIPEGVVSIGESAFERCHFPDGSGTLSLSSTVAEIDPQALFGTHYDSIIVDPNNSVYHTSGNCLIETNSKKIVYGTHTSVIPTDGSVTSIGDHAFKYAYSLESITIPEGITAIGDQAFYSCNKLTELSMSDSVKTIGNRSFYECYDLKTIKFSNGLTHIGDEAFLRCRALKSVTLPSSLETIGQQLFSECEELTSISADPANTTFHSDGNCVIDTKSKTVVAGCAASVIPTDGSVTAIGPYALYGFKAVTEINIPDNITTIAEYAFSGSNTVVSVTVPAGVTYIGRSAFPWNVKDIYFEGTEEQWNEALDDKYSFSEEINIHFEVE